MPRHFHLYMKRVVCFWFVCSKLVSHHILPLLLSPLSPLHTPTPPTPTHTRNNEIHRCCILPRSLGRPRRCPGCCTCSQHPVRPLSPLRTTLTAHDPFPARGYKSASRHSSPGLAAR